VRTTEVEERTPTLARSGPRGGLDPARDRGRSVLLDIREQGATLAEAGADGLVLFNPFLLRAGTDLVRAEARERPQRVPL